MAALEQAVQAAAPNAARVVLIAGRENVEYTAMADKIHALLTARGFACLRMASANPHHGYPPDFDRLLAEAVGWIME